MARYAYFPGCSLEGTSKEYGASALEVCRALGIELEELADWTCCGATSAHCTSREMADALAARNVVLAAETEHEALVVPCAACYNRTKRAALLLEEEGARRDRVVELLGRAPVRRVAVRHLLELLTADDVREKLAEQVKRPLEGTRVAAYYGCLLLRPHEDTGFDDPEDPQSMDRLLEVCGAEPVEWHYKNECCGASLGITQPRSVARLTERIVSNARSAGADWIVTACPLCQVNLETRQTRAEGVARLPVVYVTQVVGLALGLEARALGLPATFDRPRVAAGVGS